MSVNLQNISYDIILENEGLGIEVRESLKALGFDLVETYQQIEANDEVLLDGLEWTRFASDPDLMKMVGMFPEASFWIIRRKFIIGATADRMRCLRCGDRLTYRLLADWCPSCRTVIP